MELVFLNASEDLRVDFITPRINTSSMINVSPVLNRIDLLTVYASPLILIQLDFFIVFIFIIVLLRHFCSLGFRIFILIVRSTLFLLFKFLKHLIYCPVLDQLIDFLLLREILYRATLGTDYSAGLSINIFIFFPLKDIFFFILIVVLTVQTE